jgi:hypothetical protein
MHRYIEEFEDTKEVIIIRKLKDRNKLIGQRKKNNWTNNEQQNSIFIPEKSSRKSDREVL